MLKSMESYIRELSLIPPGSHVLCAVSGGADSICLLHALYHLREKMDFSLSAAHYNHLLRGEESQRDARFVSQFIALCCGPQRLLDGRILPAVRLYEGSGDVAAESKARGTGLEETAREMRYAFLRETARVAGADWIATAHTANDNAETLLFHLARGTGLRGLGGIAPRRDRLIRPLLTTTRREVEDYLLHYALPHMEDSTNSDDRYTRNRIRHQVLPVLDEISPGFLARMADTAQQLREDEDCLRAFAQEIADQAQPVDSGLSIDVAQLANAPAPIALRAVRLLLGQLWGGDQNCGSVHLQSVLSLCLGKSPSAQADLPHGCIARRSYDRLLLLLDPVSAPLDPGPLSLPGNTRAGSWQISCLEELYDGQLQRPWEFWLSKFSAHALTVRPRCTGDWLTLPGRKGKSVKKWMIQEKLPRFQREMLPVFDCGGAVAAVTGLGPDLGFIPQTGHPAWHITISPANHTISPKTPYNGKE